MSSRKAWLSYMKHIAFEAAVYHLPRAILHHSHTWCIYQYHPSASSTLNTCEFINIFHAFIPIQTIVNLSISSMCFFHFKHVRIYQLYIIYVFLSFKTGVNLSISSMSFFHFEHAWNYLHHLHFKNLRIYQYYIQFFRYKYFNKSIFSMC